MAIRVAFWVYSVYCVVYAMVAAIFPEYGKFIAFDSMIY